MASYTFYSIDPAYSNYNNRPFRVLRSNADNSRHEIEFDDGDRIIAFTDEINGFVKKHEKDPVSIPVSWEECGILKIPNARSIQEGMDMVTYDHGDSFELPVGSYVDGSFSLSMEDADSVGLYNHPFRNLERVREFDVTEERK